jgi:hypothetical protein
MHSFFIDAHEVFDAIIVCYVPDEVLHSLYVLKGADVMNFHVVCVFGTKDYVMRYIPVDAHFIQRSADDRTLDGVTLRYRERSSSKSVSNARSIVSIVSSDGIIPLHSALSDPSCKEIGFGFQHLELCSGFAISSHHTSIRGRGARR